MSDSKNTWEARKQRVRPYIAVLAVLLVLSVIVNVVQAYRISVLQVVTRNEFDPSPPIRGATVSRLVMTDVVGRDATIELSSASVPTVLYVFRPSCIWCQRNKARFRNFGLQIGKAYRIIGISLTKDGVDEFVNDQHFEYPVYLASESLIDSLQLSTTPQTIILSPSGEIVQNWLGAYEGRTKSAIESFFSINLQDQITAGAQR